LPSPPKGEAPRIIAKPVKSQLGQATPKAVMMGGHLEVFIGFARVVEAGGGGVRKKRDKKAEIDTTLFYCFFSDFFVFSGHFDSKFLLFVSFATGCGTWPRPAIVSCTQYLYFPSLICMCVSNGLRDTAPNKDRDKKRPERGTQTKPAVAKKEGREYIGDKKLAFDTCQNKTGAHS
jgi:hypothetical protein